MTESVIGKPRRPTIADIARRAGVSSGAVSYALNNRPGVSQETRARILQVAREAGWEPSVAARALSGGGAASVGLVVTRDAAVLGVEPFFMAFISGIEAVLSDRGFALLLQVSPSLDRELATYRSWWSARRIDGVILTDLRVDDPRVPMVGELGLPAVVVGDPSASAGVPAVWSDDAGAAAEAMIALVSQGHRRIAHVAGPREYVHTQVRLAAMRETARSLGAAPLIEVYADYTFDEGASSSRALLGSPDRPTAIVYDNDLMALAGVQAARELGLAVPEDLSVVAWDDSPLCRLTSPPLSALSRDVAAYGADAARVLLSEVAGEQPGDLRSSVPRLVERGSIAGVSEQP